MLTRLPDSQRGARAWRGEKHGVEVTVDVTPMHHRWSWALTVNGVNRRSQEQAHATADEATTAAFEALSRLLKDRTRFE